MTEAVAADLAVAMRREEEIAVVRNAEARILRLGANVKQDAEEDINQILMAHQLPKLVSFRAQGLSFALKLYPSEVILIIPELGVFQHPVEGEMLCESNNVKIPYFNAPIYLENKVFRTSNLRYILSNICRHKLAKSTKSSVP